MSRLLVISNETVEGEALQEAIRSRTGDGKSEVLVVAPALNTRLRHLTSDTDQARRAAGERLVACLARLDQANVQARGVVGDEDPLVAIEDALRVYPADEMIIATHPEERSNWLEHDLVGRARDRFETPITHIVVDTVRHEEHVTA
jgi:GABA permease